jgi:hypothetical protein
MKPLTDAEKKQLDKDLEWVMNRRAEELNELKQARENASAEAIKYFRPFAEFYNAARDYYYGKLDTKEQRRGDFRTMEVTAHISENYELILTGVWGSRCLTVKRKKEGGFDLTLGDGTTKKTLGSEDELRTYLIGCLHSDHPKVQDINEQIYKAQKLLEEVRNKAGR